MPGMVAAGTGTGRVMQRGYHPVACEFSLTEDAARRTRGHPGPGGRDQRGFAAGIMALGLGQRPGIQVRGRDLEFTGRAARYPLFRVGCPAPVVEADRPQVAGQRDGSAPGDSRDGVGTDRAAGEQAPDGLDDRRERLVLSELAQAGGRVEIRTKPPDRNGSSVRNIGVLLAVSTLLAARPRAVDSQISAKANSISTPAAASQASGPAAGRNPSPGTRRQRAPARPGSAAACRSRGRSARHRGRWPWCGTGR